MNADQATIPDSNNGPEVLSAALQNLAKLTATSCGCSVALIQASSAEADEVWYSFGFQHADTHPEDLGLVGLLTDSVELEIDDLSKHPDFADHNLLKRERIRFCQGVVLSLGTTRLGMMWVMDREPKSLTREQHEGLTNFYQQALALLYSRTAQHQLAELAEENVKTKDAFEESVAFYHSLVESLQQNILRKDRNGCFTFANQNFCNEIGMPLDEIIGKTDFDLFPENLASKYQADDRQVMESGEIFESIEEHLNAAKEQCYVQVRKTPLYDASGQVVGIQGIFWDVTEERKTQQALKYERDLWRSLLASIPDHVYFKDRESRFIKCSNELADRLGIADAEEAVGKTDFDFFTEEHARQAFEDEQRILKTGEPIIGKIEKETWHDGSVNWVLTSKLPFRDSTGEISGTFGVSKDITKLINTEQALRKAEQKYRDIFEKAVEGIFQTTPTGQYLEVNPALAHIYGYESPTQLLGSLTDIRLQLYVDPDRRQEFVQLMERRGEVHEFESEIFRRDGTRIWISETARAVKDESGKVVYYEGIAENISERKRAEEALQMARDVALESTRLKSIFLATMSHEIRTPMNGIIGMAGLLLQTPLEDEQQQFAKTIQTSAQALLDLINDILDFSKIEAGKMTLEKVGFQVNEVVESAADILADTAEKKGLELILSIDSEIPATVLGDPTRIRQIVSNLMTNAIKFTSSGEVCVVADLLERNESSCSIRVLVRDTGIGIAQEAQKQIFEPFTQADHSTTRKFGGTGLGLAICRHLVGLMRGEIQVQSSPNEGSTFCFTVPLEIPMDAPPLSSCRPKFDGLKALIVDGNQSFRQALVRTLTPTDTECIEADSAQAAHEWLDSATAKAQPPDLALIGLSLHTDAATHLFQSLNDSSHHRHSKRILFTPIGQRWSSEQLCDLGVSAVVQKPVQIRSLLDTMQRVLSPEHTSAPPLSDRGTPESDTPKPGPGSDIPSHVLVVEDNAVNQSVALHMLNKIGTAGIAVPNGIEAIAELSKKFYSVILMDCQMPELDGYETTRRIRAMEREKRFPYPEPVRIIAMTANVMEEDRRKCIDAGMDDYISKPMSMPELEAALRGQSEHRGNQTHGESESSYSQTLDQTIISNLRGVLQPGQPDPLAEIYPLFVEEGARHLAELEAAISSRDQEALRRAAHSLKGSSRNIGANTLARLCEKIETLKPESEVEAIEQYLVEIKSENSKVEKALSDLVESID